MGCGSCSTNSSVPGGCKSNGSCGTGGCGKLHVFDWLSNMALPIGFKAFEGVEIRFKSTRKDFYRNAEGLPLAIGDVVAVDASPGHDIGVVSAVGELAKIQMDRKNGKSDTYELKKIYRKASEEDIKTWQNARLSESDTMYRTRVIASELKLQMKISDVEFQGDRSKAIFYYTAEDRVDFRELIKKLADEFKVRVEMRQIGSRQEAGRLGGIGSCGRELCCSTWLTDFRTVSTSAARYQQLSINPQKLAGQCGKLKCCLNYELDMYLEAIKDFPDSQTKLSTKKGRAFNIKTDIFRGLMWFVYEGEGMNSPIPLEVKRVSEIIQMNVDGVKPDDLRDFMVEKIVVKEPDYENVVGQDSLTRFDDKNKSKRKKRPANKRRPQSGESNNETRAAKPNNGPRNIKKTSQNDQEKPANSGEKPAGNQPNKRRSNNRRKPNNNQQKNNDA